MAERKFISVRGAREHNLKGVDVDIPRDTLTVERGFFEVVFCSIEIAGLSPSI